MPPRRLPKLLAAALLALAPARAQTHSLTTIRVAAGLSHPLWCGSPPGDEERIFVAEQVTGRIRIVKNGVLLPTPFVTVTGIVTTRDERGLLGVAFHPRYADNGWFYVDYTRAADGATMIDRYRVSDDPDVADPGSRVTILGPIAQPYANHNGGNLAFGPDGYLYIGLGDGGGPPEPGCPSQDRRELLGKLLRIDVGVFPYAIPPSNPFAGNPAWRDEIWALGLRNPWRFGFDRLTGDLYIGDVGGDAREEIDFEAAGGPGGANYGWNVMEGGTCFATTTCLPYVPPCNSPALQRPIHQYDHAVGTCVIGGCVYRGCAVPDLRGTYLFADASGRLFSFRYAGGVASEHRDRTSELAPGSGMAIDSPVHIGEDARGELLIVDWSDGEVYRVVSRAPPPATDLGFGRTGSNGVVPRCDACGILASGSSAELRLRFAPPRAAALLCVSRSSNPTPIFGGTLLPVPVELAATGVCGADGSLAWILPGGSGPAALHVQFLVADAGLPSGVGFSNALRLGFLP
jgi:glucose/arabinose dehydrogenase